MKTESQLNEEIMRFIAKLLKTKLPDLNMLDNEDRETYTTFMQGLNKARQQGIEIGKQISFGATQELNLERDRKNFKQGAIAERKKIIDYIEKKMKKDRITFKTSSGSVSFRRFPEQTMRDILDQLRKEAK
jgi:hypothetical protein